MLRFVLCLVCIGISKSIKVGRFEDIVGKDDYRNANNDKECDIVCRNNGPLCDVAGIARLCNDRKLGGSIQGHCPLLCGICKPCIEHCNDPTCQDFSPFCPMMATERRCTSKAKLSKLCPNSCKVCTPCPDIKMQKMKCSDDCFDLSHKCTKFAPIAGMCGEKSPHKDFMQKNCRYSCKLCRKCNPRTPGQKSSYKAKFQQPTTKTQVCKRDVATETTVEAQCLGAHNFFRCLHGSPALTYNRGLAHSAEMYALNLAASGKPGELMVHSQPGKDRSVGVGENLAWKIQVNNRYNVSQAIADWYTEEMQYNFNQPGYSKSTGHFTQLVWKDTTSVGCGISRVGHEVYVVAHYKKKGNKKNEFTKNVNRLKKDFCEVNCTMGSCQGQDSSVSTCKCNESQDISVPSCTSRCVAYCPTPTNFKGTWIERCEGASSCTCNAATSRMQYAGAQCH